MGNKDVGLDQVMSSKLESVYFSQIDPDLFQEPGYILESLAAMVKVFKSEMSKQDVLAGLGEAARSGYWVTFW